MEMTNRQKLAIAVEQKKRKDMKRYEGSFQDFAAEQVRILPKDSSKGFPRGCFKKPNERMS